MSKVTIFARVPMIYLSYIDKIILKNDLSGEQGNHICKSAPTNLPFLGEFYNHLPFTLFYHDIKPVHVLNERQQIVAQT